MKKLLYCLIAFFYMLECTACMGGYMSVTTDVFNKMRASDEKTSTSVKSNVHPKLDDEKMQNFISRGVLWVDNVATLRTTNAEIGMVYAIKGYYSVNDGGNAFYAIRKKTLSDVDDGGSIIILNNDNVAELITGGTVNVKQFGAKGDGITNDTTAIQNAINYLKNGDVLQFGEGVYIVEPKDNTAYIFTLPAVAKLEIKGRGINSIIKIADNAGTYRGIFGVRTTHDLYVHDISFDHNCENNTLASNDYTAKGRLEMSRFV